jgi:hypothetical protein
MLDVHPPHHPTHTWKDFCIHIATITVGLLIAIGLEQTVESIHHQHQIREVREALDGERAENIKRFYTNVERHLYALAYLHNDLRIFLYLRDHPHATFNQLPGVPVWPIGAVEPLNAAWSTAQQTGVLERMPHDEVAAYTEEYRVLEDSWHVYQTNVPVQHQLVAYLDLTADATTLPAADILEEVKAIELRLSIENYYGRTLSQLAKQYPDYGPAPTEEEINPFFQLFDEMNRGTANPAQAAQTQRDIDTALAVLKQAQAKKQ